MGGNRRVNLIGGKLCTCVQIVYRILFIKCTSEYMNTCGTDGKFLYPVVMLMVR